MRLYKVTRSELQPLPLKVDLINNVTHLLHTSHVPRASPLEPQPNFHTIYNVRY